MIMEKRCKYCKKVIIQNLTKFLEDELNKDKKVIEIQCPYCGGVEEIKWTKYIYFQVL